MSGHDVASAVAGNAGHFDTLSQLLASSQSLQAAMVVLVVGIIGIAMGYRKLSGWIRGKKFYYHRPHLSKFVQVAVLPVFGVALISSVNAYIQTFELFDEEAERLAEMGGQLTAQETFVKLLNTMDILVIGYTVARLVPIILTKREKSELEKQDYEQWRSMMGFEDDEGDLFHRLFRWVPPAGPPDGMDGAKFKELMGTDEGKKILESYRTRSGAPVGSYEDISEKPFEEWKKSERSKYRAYFESCVSGSSGAGRALRTARDPEEIYPIDIWREEKRMGGFARIEPGARPPGNARRKRKNLPKSFTSILPVGMFAAVLLGVVGWWGVDLFVLATAVGGLGIGVGFALQETLQNYFAYILVRKDKIYVEGDRVKLDTGYNGYVHKITSRVTYLRHALNESVAIIPTRQLINAQIINYSKEIRMVPAVVEVGVSYLNDPRQVAAILIKVGKRAMEEVVDSSGAHLVRHMTCPYRAQNRPSCGCDKDVHVSEIEQPVVRFTKFNDSSLDFMLWVYVRDYGSQYKTKTDMMMFIHEEFKKNDIRIPWPIRTVYDGDEKREAEEIASLDAQRRSIVREYGVGDIVRGGDDE